MAIYDILCQKKGYREQQEGVCDFNGYLEDYVANLDRDDEAHDVLSALSAIDPSLKVIVGLDLNINKELRIRLFIIRIPLSYLMV